MCSFHVSTFKGVICGTYACITCTSFLAKKLLAQVTFRRYFQMCHRLNDSCLFSICCSICSLQREVSGAIHMQLQQPIRCALAFAYIISGPLLCCISPVASDISGQIQVDRMIKHHINSNNNKEAVP